MRRIPSAHTAIVVLTTVLVAAFVWWRLSTQRLTVEAYWGEPLSGSANAQVVRAEEWLATYRRAADVLGAIAAQDGRIGGALEEAVRPLFASGDLVFLSIRNGSVSVRCSGLPLRTSCEPASPQFAIPSPTHPQARRIRPFRDGRALVPAVGTIPARGHSPGGVVTLWLDPEATLFPRLVATRSQAIPGAGLFFVRLGTDSATIVGSGSDGKLWPRRRVPVESLPPLIARPSLSRDAVVGRGPDGELVVAGHAYIPALRWRAYRTLPRAAALAPYERSLMIEGGLAFALGSFVIGVLLWTHRESRDQRSRAELIQSRLESLQAQIRPHFLFNALNTIATLIHENPRAADAMLLRLADLLRLSLEQSESTQIPLRREVELFDAYIALERVRFGRGLHVTRRIEPNILDAPVIPWVLQPLAENAIKHGAAYTRGQARLELDARREDGALVITLADDGPGGPPREATEGIGLRNTRRRLATLYGDAATLALSPRPGHGTIAVLRIPVQVAEATMAASRAVAQSVPAGATA